MERLIFDLLAMTSENKQLIDMTKVLVKMLAMNDEQTMKMINDRILQHSLHQSNQQIADKNKQEKTFFEHLISNMEKDVREMGQILLTYCVNRLFEMSNTDMIESIMTHVFAMLPEECSKNWLKIHQYLQFLYDVTKSGEQQLDYMVRKRLVTKLLDFFLENDSPLATGNPKRNQMGSNYANPPMEPLILAVSFITRNQPFIIETPALPNGDNS